MIQQWKRKVYSLLTLSNCYLMEYPSMRKLALSALVLSMATGCSSMSNSMHGYENTALYGAIGTAVGATAGALINHDNRAQGAAIGGLIAGGAGAAYGYNADKMEQEVRQKLAAELATTGISVQRVNDNMVNVVIPDKIAFEPGTSTLTPLAYKILDEMGRTMAPHSNVSLTVTAVNPNDPTQNYALAHERAQVVAHQLAARGISPQRMTMMVDAPQVDIQWSGSDLTALPLRQQYAAGMQPPAQQVQQVIQQQPQYEAQNQRVGLQKGEMYTPQPRQIQRGSDYHGGDQQGYGSERKPYSGYVPSQPVSLGNPYANGGAPTSQFERAGLSGLVKGLVTAVTQGPEAGLRQGVSETMRQGTNAATQEVRGVVNDEVNDFRYDR
jgi:outer membrane protein OmpA-like peptidoglycan-associated protein